MPLEPRRRQIARSGGLLAAGFAAGFGLLARARDDRALHPHGIVFAATVRFPAPVPGVAALSAPREVAGLLRLSRALGLPPPLPDILGFALRLHDLHGPGRSQDLLLASSPPPPAHVVLAPARSFEQTWFTGLLPYRLGRRQTILVAHASGQGRFALGTADALRRRRSPLAEITVAEALHPAPAEAAEFDPILRADPAFRQEAGPWDAVRARAYSASRAGRGAAPRRPSTSRDDWFAPFTPWGSSKADGRRTSSTGPFPQRSRVVPPFRGPGSPIRPRRTP